MGKKKGKKNNKNRPKAADDGDDEKFLLGVMPEAPDKSGPGLDVLSTGSGDGSDGATAAPAPAPAAKKKNKKKNKKAAVPDEPEVASSAFGMLELDDGEDDDSDGVVGGGGGGGGSGGFGYAFGDLDDEDEADATPSEDDDEEEPEEKTRPSPAPSTKAGKNKNNKNNKAGGQGGDDDLDDILAQLDAPSSKGRKKSKKGKKEKQAQQESLDDILAELDGPVKPADDVDAIMAELEAPKSESAVATPSAAEAAAGDSSADVDESKLSKAQLKRLRKKQATAQKSSEETADDDQKEDTSSSKKKKKGKKKPNVSALKAALQRQKEEEEKFRELQLQKQREAEEAERKAEEERKRQAEEKERRAQEKKEARERLKKEGKLLSKAQKKKRAAEERRLQQMREAGLVGEVPKRRVGGGRRRDKGKGKGTSHKDQQREADLQKAKEAAQRRQEREQRELQIARLQREIQELEDAMKRLEDESADELSEDSEEDVLPQTQQVAADEPVGESWEDDVADSWEEDAADDGPATEDGGWEALADADDADSKAEAQEAAARRAQIEQERGVQQRKKAKEAAKAKKREEKRARKAELHKKTQLEVMQRQKALDELKLQQQQQEQAQSEEEAKEERAQRTYSTVEEQEEEDARRNKKGKDLRSPICCILGHVDTGKTKLLDKIRSTNVQDREAGGITQQIGATYFPMETIQQQTEELNSGLERKIDYDCMPGLLIIDTPGHESFTNLRSRGSNLCDIAILVVDIMHGLEPQTLESIDLLRRRRTPFVVALNKIDRMLDWNPLHWGDIRKSLAQQPAHSQREFHNRVTETKVLFAEQGLNCELYYNNTDLSNVVSLVPTSAHTGEGIPDLLMLLVRLTQQKMSKRLTYISELQCTVLEVKMVEGLGTTIDVVLVNGVLHEGDTIVVCGLTGPIVTTCRALLTPQPLKELRVKGEYVHHKRVKAAMGVKISAAGLESAVAGTQLLRVDDGADVEELKDEVMQDLASILSRIDRSGKGVCVQASTLGSLEALLQFLGDQKIPVSGINIGPVHKKDVMKAAVMLEHKPELAIILAFDVRVSPDAAELAEQMGVKIFTADIIYHLFDMASKYMEDMARIRREQAAPEAVFPVVLDIIPDCIFNYKDPMLFGCRVTEGLLKIGTPLCLPSKGCMSVGRVMGIEKNHQAVALAEQGDEVAVKIDHSRQPQLAYGRQFDYKDQLVSKLSRRSIDLLKANFKDDLSMDQWRLVVKLKRMQEIM